MNEEYIRKLMREKINEWMNSRKLNDGDFHISSMAYDCRRLLYYQYWKRQIELQPIEEEEDSEAVEKEEEDKKDDYMYNVWVGTKLHETPLTDKHEYNMKLEYRHLGKSYFVSGTIDEVVEDEEGTWILDKKFVHYTPKYEMQEHHRKQVQYYAVMYWKTTGIKPVGIIVLYFSKIEREESKIVRPYIERFKDGELSYIAGKMDNIVKDVITHIAEETLPERNVSWYCRYCRFKEICKKNEDIR